MPPRGSNSEVEQARIRRGEQSDFSEAKRGQGARHGEKVAFHGKQKNTKNPPSPR